jgi:hypothetical protein
MAIAAPPKEEGRRRLPAYCARLGGRLKMLRTRAGNSAPSAPYRDRWPQETVAEIVMAAAVRPPRTTVRSSGCPPGGLPPEGVIHRIEMNGTVLAEGTRLQMFHWAV